MVVLMKECGLATIWRVWATNALRGPRPVACGQYSDAYRSAKNNFYYLFLIMELYELNGTIVLLLLFMILLNSLYA